MKQSVTLVAGGAGFIGSNLVDALFAKGHMVVVLDTLVTSREENLAVAKTNPLFSFIKHDITDVFRYDKRIDYVFHLASPASVPDYQLRPLETARANSVGTMNLLELARKHNAKFLFASTSEIYGDPKEQPQKETYWGNVNPVGPRASYDESKRFGEMVTMVYNRQYSLNTRIARIFNTYGPRMRKTDGRVVSNFINQAISVEPITIYGDGAQTRSLCYVDDMVAGLVAMMESEMMSGEIVNLGNPSEYTMKALAEKIKAMTGSKSEIVYKPLPPDDPRERRPDISKAKTILGWEPKVSVDDGLTRTIEYYRHA